MDMAISLVENVIIVVSYTIIQSAISHVDSQTKEIAVVIRI